MSHILFSFADPLPRDAPKDLRWGNFTVGPDGSLNVIISWDASPEGDLEIHHYKISWNLRVPTKPMMAAKKDTWEMTGVRVILLHVLPPLFCLRNVEQASGRVVQR